MDRDQALIADVAKEIDRLHAVKLTDAQLQANVDTYRNSDKGSANYNCRLACLTEQTNRKALVVHVGECPAGGGVGHQLVMGKTTCTGTTYPINPDAPEDGSDIHHDGPCPAHPPTCTNCGEWDSEEAYAQELADDTRPFSSDSPEAQVLEMWPYQYIDWERATRDLFMGDFWSADSGHGTVYVFRSY